MPHVFNVLQLQALQEVFKRRFEELSKYQESFPDIQESKKTKFKIIVLEHDLNFQVQVFKYLIYVFRVNLMAIVRITARAKN